MNGPEKTCSTCGRTKDDPDPATMFCSNSFHLHTFRVGDRVRKRRGYSFPGIVVAVFKNLNDHYRVVVECTAIGVEGCLHIYAPDQLEADPHGYE